MQPFVEASSILPNTVWEAASGSGNKVTVSLVENGWVEYYWMNNGEKVTHMKDVFSFQVRYKPEGYGKKWKEYQERLIKEFYEDKH